MTFSANSLSTSTELEDIEVSLLVEGIQRRYGIDFRNYALESLKRRILFFMTQEKLPTISALQERILHDKSVMDRFLLIMSITVTSMFRDPSFYLAFRKNVVPLLRTYPTIRIWHAGCATGEEVYSMAILLEEEGLYDRCRLYGTDFNEQALEHAQTGIYALDTMQPYTQNYLQSGGKASFSEYYTAAYGNAIFRGSLRKNLTFSHHNLTQDQSFNQFQVIICRNVLMYFDKTLQSKVYGLFHDSLVTLGILCLGKQESMNGSAHYQHYKELVNKERIYRKVG